LFNNQKLNAFVDRISINKGLIEQREFEGFDAEEIGF